MKRETTRWVISLFVYSAEPHLERVSHACADAPRERIVIDIILAESQNGNHWSRIHADHQRDAVKIVFNAALSANVEIESRVI